MKTIEELRALWEQLADIPVDDSDCIDQPFHGFAIGTHREDVWRWFESQNPAFSVGDMQNRGGVQ